MTNLQPEALRLADALKTYGPTPWAKTAHEAAAELRRLHEVNQVLLETLAEIEKLTTPDDWLELPRIGRLARAAIAKATEGQ